ncbi:MAG TPA: HEAT repeat domain-containing protein [Myxococcota bacterium]|nr:HEAT repeat domain-containing protein [Myxococcota bacterium]HRY96334.1 HEAT repeat domain-containing protein [Myxococcota bacterium]HSA21541.1 HEAT repeat domain-containing protein [Myxococcota bacterium]
MEQKKVDPKNVYISGTSKMQPPGKVNEELKDEEIAPQVSAAKDVFNEMQKSLKQIALYRHNTGQYGEYCDRTYKLLAGFLEQYENLPLRVEQLGFKLHGEWVYQEDASEMNLAHKFYRDGVRILVFRRGLPAEELLNFILILMTNIRSREYQYEDMVSLLWKGEFQCLEYVVVDSVSVGGESEEQARAEVDKIVNYLYKKLTSATKDTLSFARISLEDLDIELEDVEQAKGLVIKGMTATDELKERVQKELEEEDENRVLPKLVLILFKVLEDELDQDLGQALGELFVQLLDSFLIHEDFQGINQMLRKLAALERKSLPQGNLARVQQIEREFFQRMGEAERIAQVAKILDGMAEIKDPQNVLLYLSRLEEQSIVPMLQALEGMERQEARRMFCDALAVLGKEQIEVFVRRLESTKANLVRDMMYLIDKLNPPDKLKIVAKLLDHPNLAIRLEALQTLSASGADSVRPYVLKALGDGDMQMRVTAARMLTHFDLSTATKTLLAMVQHPDFGKKEPNEQTAFFAALASTNTQEAMEYFVGELRATSVISRKKLAEHKRLMVNGLALSGSIAAYKLLKSELEAGIKEEDVAQAAERACAKLRDKLLGAGAGEAKG